MANEPTPADNMKPSLEFKPEQLEQMKKLVSNLPQELHPFLNLTLSDKVYIARENQAIISGTFNLLRLGVNLSTPSHLGLLVPPLPFYFKIQAFTPGLYSMVIAIRVLTVNGKPDGRATPTLGAEITIPDGDELAGDGTFVLPPQYLGRIHDRVFVTDGENRATLQLEGWINGRLANAQRVTICWTPVLSAAPVAKASPNAATPRTPSDAPEQR